MINLPTNYQIELLRTHMLTYSGLTSVAPWNCRALSFQVMAKTKLGVSETTIKRFYGLTASRFNPSLFTLNTICKYCDFKGWDDFCKMKQAELTPADTSPPYWLDLQQNAHKITEFTLQALKYRSGIPYDLTIDRQFTAGFFDDFKNSGLIGAVIAAPAGYGKTVALCHWLDIKLSNNNAVNDIVLFYSSTALMSVLNGGKTIDDWMHTLFGFNTHTQFETLLDSPLQGKFYMILDGIDEDMFKKEQFHLLLNQLAYLVAFYQQFKWFRIVLTMKASTWAKHQDQFEFGDIKWFTGCPPAGECINVPLLNTLEINALSAKITATAQHNLPAERAATFKHPVDFKYFYSNKGGLYSKVL
jgi:hypothetical protein